MLASGKVRVGDLISDEFPLDRAADAFRRAGAKGVLKVLLIPS
jgi:threonine dehydrogenase-like Zn-dependent dehydrogenase